MWALIIETIITLLLKFTSIVMPKSISPNYAKPNSLPVVEERVLSRIISLNWQFGSIFICLAARTVKWEFIDQRLPCELEISIALEVSKKELFFKYSQ